jgi:alanine racemase
MHSPNDNLAGGRLTIDLGALAGNWRAIAAHVPAPVETSAVVKADGYGLGIEEVGAALAAVGCRTFFVALPDEGRRLRSAAPGAVIYILAGLLPGSAAALAADDLRPVLNSMPEIEEWAAAKRGGNPTGSAIHVDTGMNRLGLSLAEAHTLAGRTDLVAMAAPSLLMSHLVISEIRNDGLNTTQLSRFREVRALFPSVPASLANTAGIFLGQNFHFDLVRPGIGIYGATPGPGVSVPMKVVATAEARVLMVRSADAGSTVGYGATRRLMRPSRIAILGAGYADGYHRRTAAPDSRPGPHVFLRGRPAPLLGRVSMDLIAVDVTDIPDVVRGDWAELFGPNVPVDEVAGFAGTVGYELLTGLGHRYDRRYVHSPRLWTAPVA